MAAVGTGMDERADGALELAIPLALVAWVSLPAVMLWVLAVALIAAGEVLNVFLLGAIATSVLVIRFGRMGATVDHAGLDVRTLGRSRYVPWRDVEGFSVLRVSRGQLVVTIAGGESLAIVGRPRRDYRRRRYRSGRLLDNMLADLRHRLEIARATDLPAG